MDLAVQDNTNSGYRVPDFISPEIFRAYDIRGAVGPQSISEDLAYAIGLAVGSEIRKKLKTVILVSRDGRLSSDSLSRALITGLCDTGLRVLNIGVVPTPLLYFASFRLGVSSGVMVTGSHNPRDHNGFKIVLEGHTLTKAGIQRIYNRIQQKDFIRGSQGEEAQLDIIQDYQQYIIGRVRLARPLKIVVDAGNGVAGVVAPRLYRQLGCAVTELFCTVDGNFPNHHPDPTVPENLNALIEAVKEQEADVGLAFDGDADRLGVVTNKGEIIWPDRQLMLFAIDVLARLPGSEIIFDVKCSRNLPQVIRQHSGHPIMWKTGHSILKAKLFERRAPLAGEMSGHIFFRDEWFGFDDGIYAGARLLSILARQSRSISRIFESLPNSYSTPELKLPMPEKDKAPFMARLLQEAEFTAAEKITLDGLRVEFECGWGLIRPSNTTPCLTLRFEADTPENLRAIQNQFREQLLKIDKDLLLPF